MANRLRLQLGTTERDAIMKEQQIEIANLYKDWADDLGDLADYYSTKTTWSASQQQIAVNDLKRRLTVQANEIEKEVRGTIERNMHTMAEAVCTSNVEWLKDLGFAAEGLSMAFRSVPDTIVRNLVTGKVYESGWSLSKAIWSDNKKALHDIYGIVAGGVAKNTSIEQIAKDLKAYVNPDKRKDWNLKMSDGVKIYKHQVDYNAQRLARTLVQHTYQQSVMETTKNNPFIKQFIWRANGSRSCPLCLSRNGRIFPKNDLPMDHPMGMCVMDPVVDLKSTRRQLADWFKSDSGTYPDIDKFAKEIGYKC